MYICLNSTLFFFLFVLFVCLFVCLFVFLKESKCFCLDTNNTRDKSCSTTPCGFNNELLCATDESNVATAYYRSGKIGIYLYTNLIRSLSPKAIPLIRPDLRWQNIIELSPLERDNPLVRYFFTAEGVAL